MALMDNLPASVFVTMRIGVRSASTITGYTYLKRGTQATSDMGLTSLLKLTPGPGGALDLRNFHSQIYEVEPRGINDANQILVKLDTPGPGGTRAKPKRSEGYG